MAQKPKTMLQIRTIIKQRIQSKSIREIARITGSSRNTVRAYLRRITEGGYSLSEALNLDETALGNIARPSDEKPPPESRLTRLQAAFPQMEKELSRTGVTRQLLWQEYLAENADGFGYTQFCHYFNRWLKRADVVARFDHRAGEKLMVDFAGKKMAYINRASGEVVECPVLVAVLPHSGYTYAEAVSSQKQEDFIRALAGALRYLGGSTGSLLTDNLKSAVTKSDRYEPKFTELMEQFCEHYGLAPMATRPYKPRDKGPVEGAVRIVYQRVFAPLRNREFFNLHSLNAAIRRQVDSHNNQLFQGRQHSRSQLFAESEKPLLQELPTFPFQISKTVLAKVQKNYHVILGEDQHQYSVPYTLVGVRVRIVYTNDNVEIYDGLDRVVCCQRNRRKYGYTTDARHMPENHRSYYAQKGWDGEYFKKQAGKIGEKTLEAITRILENKAFPEQTYNSCLGVLSLGKKYGGQRLEAACTRALQGARISYMMLKNILKSNLDQAPLQAEIDFTPPDHDNLRGSSYYR